MKRYIKSSTMKGFTDTELQQILDDLDKGIYFCGIDKNNRGIGLIYKTSKGNIGWRHAGESANEFTIDGLRFVLETIFGDCIDIAEAIYDDDFLNYVPVDRKYKGVDDNMHHYNTEKVFRQNGFWLDENKDRHENLEFINEETGEILDFDTWEGAEDFALNNLE